MKTISGICTGLLVLGLLCLSGIAAAQEDNSDTVITDDIQAYDGPIGADSPLYGLKLALEDMDESFTANETERVDKQMDHARLRLSEVRRSFDMNQSDSAEQALNNYWMKMNLTNTTIANWGSNASWLAQAQKRNLKHQIVLEDLLEKHPNSTGLQRAYNNSIRLEERFDNKTGMRFNRTMEKNNQTILKAIRFEEKEQDHKGWPGMNATINTTRPQPNGTHPAMNQTGWDKEKRSGNDNPLANVTRQVPDGNPQQGKDHQQQGGSQLGTGSNNKGNGNSHNK